MKTTRQARSRRSRGVLGGLLLTALAAWLALPAVGCSQPGNAEGAQEATGGTEAEAAAESEAAQPPGNGILVLKETSILSWMPMNNSFLSHKLKPGDPCADPDTPGHGPIHNTPGAKVNHGVFVQIGSFRGVGMDVPAGIGIDGNNYCVNDLPCDTEQIHPKGKAVWVDLVPAGTEPGTFMTRKDHLWYLYYEPRDDEDCSTIKCTGKGCESVCIDGKKSPAGYCLRKNSIHGGLTPRGVVTYWPGPRGYQMEMRGPGRPIHSFLFKEPVDAHVYLVDGGDTPEVFKNVQKVEIASRPGPYHGGYHDPPMLRP